MKWLVFNEFRNKWQIMIQIVRCFHVELRNAVVACPGQIEVAAQTRVGQKFTSFQGTCAEALAESSWEQHRAPNCLNLSNEFKKRLAHALYLVIFSPFGKCSRNYHEPNSNATPVGKTNGFGSYDHLQGQKMLMYR